MHAAVVASLAKAEAAEAAALNDDAFSPPSVSGASMSKPGRKSEAGVTFRPSQCSMMRRMFSSRTLASEAGAAPSEAVPASLEQPVTGSSVCRFADREAAEATDSVEERESSVRGDAYVPTTGQRTAAAASLSAAGATAAAAESGLGKSGDVAAGAGFSSCPVRGCFFYPK